MIQKDGNLPMILNAELGNPTTSSDEAIGHIFAYGAMARTLDNRS